MKTKIVLTSAAFTALVLVLLVVVLWRQSAQTNRPLDQPPDHSTSGHGESGSGIKATQGAGGPGAENLELPVEAMTSRGRPAIVNLRTAEETEALKKRHLPYLDALGWRADTPIQPRRPMPKEPLGNPPGTQHRITVKFVDDLMARALPDNRLIISGEEIEESLLKVIEAYGLRFRREHNLPDEELARLEARAIIGSREMPADLSGMLVAIPGESDPKSVRAAAEALLGLDVVEYVTISSMDSPPPPPAPFDIEPPSDLLTNNQTYRTDAGISMDWAWQEYGTKGQGIRVTNVEYAHNTTHEDLATLVKPQAGVNSYYTNHGDDHGTAVLGILTAAENAYGMTGMIPQSSVWFYPEHAIVNNLFQSRVAAITAAIAASGEGDVTLLEMQTPGAQGGYGPAEYSQDVWNVVKTGTDAGVHVVAAAGNGNENLDAPEYAAYRNRGDSGAIIVGAGDSAHAKLSYSTYGSRVNLQGWGGGVATLGYGSLRHYGSDQNQKYTATFNGTSSASPIITSAVVALQSFAVRHIGSPLSPAEMRQLLVDSGKPQSGDISMPIGSLPDLRTAVEEMKTLYSTPLLSDLTLSALYSTPELSGLTLGSCSLNPPFDPAAEQYTSSVKSPIASIILTPRTLYASSAIKVRVKSGAYMSVVSGSRSEPLPLEIGTNTVEILVTARSGASRTYTVTATWEPSRPSKPSNVKVELID